MYDAVVVGGGPTGSYTSALISKAGYDVLLIEEHEVIGRPVQCAGLITPRVFDMVDFARHCIINRIKGADIYSPEGQQLMIGGSEVNAVVIDRGEFDRSLMEFAKSSGATVRSGVKVQECDRNDAFWKIKVKGKDGLAEIESRLLIGADGATSTIRQLLDIPPPQYYLNGIGAELEGVDIPTDRVKIFVGNEVAPNFFAWMIPTGNNTRVGLGMRDAPETLLHYFDRLFEDPVSSRYLKGSEIKSRSSGRIPLGLLDRTHANGAMLVGDAASQVKATSGGGIYPGLVCSGFCAKAAIRSLENDDLTKKSLAKYHKDWTKDIGDELKKDVMIHRVFSSMTDKQFEEVFKMLANEEIIELINRVGDIDYPSRLAWTLLRKEPRFLKYAGKFLKLGLPMTFKE